MMVKMEFVEGQEVEEKPKTKIESESKPVLKKTETKSSQAAKKSKKEK